MSDSKNKEKAGEENSQKSLKESYEEFRVSFGEVNRSQSYLRLRANTGMEAEYSPAGLTASLFRAQSKESKETYKISLLDLISTDGLYLLVEKLPGNFGKGFLGNSYSPLLDNPVEAKGGVHSLKIPVYDPSKGSAGAAHVKLLESFRDLDLVLRSSQPVATLELSEVQMKSLFFYSRVLEILASSKVLEDFLEEGAVLPLDLELEMSDLFENLTSL